MKKRHIVRNTLIVLVVIILGISLSADLTLRAAVFLKSPVSAFTMEYREVENEASWGRKYEITENVPVDRQTRNDMYTWGVYDLGPFHFASYYGEG